MKKRKLQKRKPLTDQQKAAARLFFEAYKPGQIASILGIHRSTVWRWRNRPDFDRELRRITDKWLREKRRETLREIHNSPEYKQRQARRYYARKKLPKVTAKLNAARGTKEFRAAYREFERTYNDAYFDGKTPAEYLYFLEQKIRL